MPAHIRAGIPVNQRKHALGQWLVPCRCSECLATTFRDPKSGTYTSGNLISVLQWKKHSKAEKSKALALQRLSELPEVAPSISLDHKSDIPIAAEQALGDWESHNLGAAEPGSSSTKMLRKKRKTSSQQPHPFPAELRSVQRRLNSYGIATLRGVIRENPLQFIVSPTALGKMDLALDPNSTSNHHYLDRVSWITTTLPHIELQWRRNGSIFTAHDRLLAIVIINSLRLEREKMLKVKEEEWVRQADANANSVLATTADNKRYMHMPTRIMEPLVCLCYLLVATLHLLSNISRDDCSLSLNFLKHIVTVSLQDSTNVGARRFQQIPSDVRTVISSLAIEPVYTAYTCCPRCFCTYKIDPNVDSSIPEFCSHQQTPSSEPCGTRLRKLHGTGVRPVRRFLYQDLNDWLGWMYSRPDIEIMLDTYPTTRPQSKTSKTDMWDGTMLRDFKDAGGEPFLMGPPGEGRLVFGINMDGFGVYNQKAGGKRNSVCGIYMICFNLPPELRYKTENMFLVGIVPGPTEPSVDQVNHVIRPLVDSLVPLWHTGLFIVKTHKYPLGRLIRGALLPVICDLPAARKISGLGSHSSKHFCSECYCTLGGINNSNRSAWILRDQDAHRVQANRWKNAVNKSAQETLFKAHGIRWSELLRLPYWDPTKHVVIDTMHGFYLRMFHRHIRDIWGMKADVEDGQGGLVTNGLDAAKTNKAQHILRFGSAIQLQGLPNKMLQYLCTEHGLGNEGDLDPISALLSYRIECGWFSEDGVCLERELHQKVTKDNLPDALAVAPNLPNFSKNAEDGTDHDLYTPSQPSITSGMDIRTVKDAIVIERRPGILSDVNPLPITVTPADVNGSNDDNSRGRNLPLAPDEILEKIYRSKNRITAAKSLNKALLLFLCIRVFQKPMDHFKGKYKAQLAEELISARAEEERRPDFIPPPVLDSGRTVPTVVLGKNTLKAIREDMENIKLPSGTSAAPKHPGEVSFGSFKADEWKAFATINLPITLTRLWGHMPDNDRRHQMLNNYMDLVSASRLANLYIISENDIDLYDMYIERYLKGLRELYPLVNLTPYQHMSLHLADQMRRFGPTHSWRCYAFERYNGMVQKISTNKKSGEMEVTMFLRFIMMQRLRALFIESNIPQEIYSIMEAFEKRYSINIRSDVLYKESAITGREIILKQKDIPLCPPNLHSALQILIHKIDPSPGHHIPKRISEVGAIERFSQIFNAATALGKSPYNGHVMFRLNLESEWSAGVIQYLFSHQRWTANDKMVSQTFAIIKSFSNLSDVDAKYDIFRKFPVAGGRLFYNKLVDIPILVPFGNIVAHVSVLVLSVLNIESECVHALPLNK